MTLGLRSSHWPAVVFAITLIYALSLHVQINLEFIVVIALLGLKL